MLKMHQTISFFTDALMALEASLEVPRVKADTNKFDTERTF